jgi:hypothetical protein
VFVSQPVVVDRGPCRDLPLRLPWGKTFRFTEKKRETAQPSPHGKRAVAVPQLTSETLYAVPYCIHFRRYISSFHGRMLATQNILISSWKGGYCRGTLCCSDDIRMGMINGRNNGEAAACVWRWAKSETMRAFRRLSRKIKWYNCLENKYNNHSWWEGLLLFV